MYWNDKHSVILRHFLSNEVVNRIHDKAKSMGVSLNTLMLAAFMKYNTRFTSVGMAVDARINGNRTMSNQATGISADYTYNHAVSFEENVKRLHAKIYKKLASPIHRYFILHFIPLFTPSLTNSMLMVCGGLCENKTSKKFASLMCYSPLKTTALSFTNLTRLDISDRYSNFQIKNICFIPPVVSYSYQTIGTVTMPDGMNITLHSMSDRFCDNEKRAFYDAIHFLESDV